MALKHEMIQIQLTRISPLYAPGETVKGEIVVQLLKTECIETLRLILSGTCKVDNNVDNRFQFSDTIRGEETYFSTNTILYGGKDDVVLLKKGKTTFLFSFELPDDIPSHFEHKFGYIRYKVTVIMERPGNNNYKDEMYFRVESPLKLNQPLISIDDNDAKNVCRFLPCFINGYMRFRFRIPKNGFTCGEKIPLTVNINNQSSMHVKKITMTFIQNLTFYNREPFTNKRSEKHVLQRVTKSGPFLKTCEELVEMKVPSITTSSIQDCKFISINYKLRVNVSISGCNFGVEKIYDIFIGSNNSKYIHTEFIHNSKQVIAISRDAGIQRPEITYYIPEPVVDTYVHNRTNHTCHTPEPVVHNYAPEPVVHTHASEPETHACASDDSPPSYGSAVDCDVDGDS